MEFYAPTTFHSDEEYMDTLVEEQAHEEWAAQIEAQKYLDSEWD
jgi:hypothetical protein